MTDGYGVAKIDRFKDAATLARDIQMPAKVELAVEHFGAQKGPDASNGILTRRREIGEVASLLIDGRAVGVVHMEVLVRHFRQNARAIAGFPAIDAG